MGKLANTVRANVQAAIEQRKVQLAREAMERRFSAEEADVTLPGRRLSPGTQHLVNQIREEIEDIFCGLGYTVEDGPFVETTYYNFTALNAPEDHPSRSAKDTFYVEDNAPEGKEAHVLGESDVLLRTQTSGVQVHVMEEKKPPIYMICPGTVFRPDTPDANHLPQFTQVEGLVGGRGHHLGDLKGSTTSREIFGRTAQPATARTSSRSPSPAARWTSRAACATESGCRFLQRGPAGSRDPGQAWSTPTCLGTWASTREVLRLCVWYVGGARRCPRHDLPDLRMLMTGDMRFLSSSGASASNRVQARPAQKGKYHTCVSYEWLKSMVDLPRIPGPGEGVRTHRHGGRVRGEGRRRDHGRRTSQVLRRPHLTPPHVRVQDGRGSYNVDEDGTPSHCRWSAAPRTLSRATRP